MSNAYLTHANTLNALGKARNALNAHWRGKNNDTGDYVCITSVLQEERQANLLYQG